VKPKKMSDDEKISCGEELEQNSSSLVSSHCTKVMASVKKGKKKGSPSLHFQCNYCPKSFAGPSNSSFTIHLKKLHPSRCPELVNTEKPKPIRKFFGQNKMKHFNQDIFMGYLIKLIVR
jgi:hypothetical protein